MFYSTGARREAVLAGRHCATCCNFFHTVAAPWDSSRSMPPRNPCACVSAPHRSGIVTALRCNEFLEVPPPFGPSYPIVCLEKKTLQHVGSPISTCVTTSLKPKLRWQTVQTTLRSERSFCIVFCALVKNVLNTTNSNLDLGHSFRKQSNFKKPWRSSALGHQHGGHRLLRHQPDSLKASFPPFQLALQTRTCKRASCLSHT